MAAVVMASAVRSASPKATKVTRVAFLRRVSVGYRGAWIGGCYRRHKRIFSRLTQGRIRSKITLKFSSRAVARWRLVRTVQSNTGM